MLINQFKDNIERHDISANCKLNLDTNKRFFLLLNSKKKFNCKQYNHNHSSQESIFFDKVKEIFSETLHKSKSEIECILKSYHDTDCTTLYNNFALLMYKLTWIDECYKSNIITINGIDHIIEINSKMQCKVYIASLFLC